MILRVNKLFCSWVGRSEAELVSQRKLQELFTIGGRIFHQTHWVPLLQMQLSVSEVKFELLHKDGSAVPIVLNAIRRQGDGAVVHDIAAFVARDRDTYEREILATGKRLAEAAAASVKLEELAKDRALFAEQMLGIVSHDLRNPLAVVEMSATALLVSGVSPAQQEVLERMNRATSRASRMIRELLDFTQARIGAGIAIQLKSIELSAAVNECLDELRHAYPASKFAYSHDEQGDCDADADRIIQMVGNLVTNAIAYGEPDSLITVTSSVTADACLISVHNDGPEIPADIGAQLFQPMTRGHQGPNGARSVGLGLYIVREIARSHGGTISASSSAQAGTTFTVVWPRRTA